MSELHLPDLQQLGLTDLASEVWLTRDRDGRLKPIRIDDMTPDHRTALLRWIRTNCLVLDRHQRRLIAHLRKTGFITVDEAGARLRALDETAPAVWVEDTAVVRRLVQLAAAPDRPLRPLSRRLLPARLRRPRRTAR